MKIRLLVSYSNLILFAMLMTSGGQGSVPAEAQLSAAPPRFSKATVPAYPLKLSSNRRYLVDQKNRPFLIVGDSPQGLICQLSEAQAERYFADRQAHGFNTAGWIDVACAGRDFPADKDGLDYDGVRPFTGFIPGGADYTHYDLSKPNEAYFARLDRIIKLAERHDILVFIDPMETIGWLQTLRNNGPAVAYGYGQYLGRRYKNFPNVTWLNGNDFNNWNIPADDTLAQAVAKGIQSVDPEQIQTVEINTFTSSSLDDQTWIPIISLNATYTYAATYIQMLHSYNQTPVMPAFLVEAHYDLEDVGTPSDYGTPAVLRRQEYWTMLSGGIGQFYGNRYTWSFAPGWESHLDTPGVAQLTIWKDFFSSLPWQDLVPDQNHTVVTAGFGDFGSQERTVNSSDFSVKLHPRVSQSDYTTAAKTPDGSLVIVYMPTARTITVSMANVKAPSNAMWFDPTIGNYIRAIAGPVTNTGMQQFTPPGKNHDGDSDWVLILNTSDSHESGSKAQRRPGSTVVPDK